MYGYGYRYNSGLVVGAGGGAPFTNTYSTQFDGVDDYVDCGNISELNGVTEATWSIWSAKGDTTDDYLMSCYSSTSSLQQYLFHQYSDRINIYLSNSGGTLRLMNRTSYTFNVGEWYHIGIVYNEAEVSNADKVKVYINGILQINQVAGFALTSLRSTTAITSIGRAVDFTTKEYNGNIDEVAIFNSAISIGDVWDGSGQPTDLSLLATPPIAWYRMGDNGSYKSPQWLLPSNENKDKVSNYSTQFDGIDDYFDLASSVDLGINNTISAWVKRSDILNLDSITGESSYSNGVGIYISSQQRVYMKIGAFITFWYNVSGFGILNQVDTWFHLAIVRQGNDATLYLNGSPTYVTSGWGTSITTKFDRIGAFALTGGNPMFGNLDEIAGFDSALTDLQINDIYNGGEPTTLPSGAVAHYKMGEEATFSGGLWTVPDSVGSNNGTSNAMTIEDRVGEAPNSENNALSYNMESVDRTTDVPT